MRHVPSPSSRGRRGIGRAIARSLARRASTSRCRFWPRGGRGAWRARALEPLGGAAALPLRPATSPTSASHRRHRRRASSPASAGSTARQQCRHRRAGARRRARPHAREFRHRDGRQPARHAVLHPGLPARDARAAGDRAMPARSSPSPPCPPRWPRPSAPTTASPRPALAMAIKDAGLAPRAGGHRRVRGPPRHHPHRR